MKKVSIGGAGTITHTYRLLMLGWTLVMAIAAVWTIIDHTKSIDAINLAHARAYIEKDVAYRRWNALRGGLYAPISQHTPPNPHLTVPQRDVTTDSGTQLTLINPAYMTRQVHELMALDKGVLGHITSLNPIRPGNDPDAWEAEALKAFETGEEEVSGLAEINGQTYLRLMRPLITEKVCLKCHEIHGDKEGDIRGGISVSIPYAPIAAFKHRHQMEMLVSNAGIWGLGLAGIFLGGRITRRRVRQRDRVQEELKRSEARLRSVFLAAPVGVGVVVERVFKDVNQQLCKITGYDPEELVDKSARLLYPSDEAYEFVGREKYAQIRKHGMGTVETPWLRKDGQIIHVLLSSAPLDRNDWAKGVTFTALDITKRKQDEEKLRQAAAVFASTAEGVTITDLEGTILDVNQAFSDITGYTRDEVIGENPRILKSERHDRIFYQGMWKSLLTVGQWRGEIWNRRKDGYVYPELLTISSVKDRQGDTTGYVGVFADITSIKQSEERLDYLAHHDPLTDLPNRLLFNARLRQSIKHSYRQHAVLAVVFIDLDHFKHINDSLGHTAGDELLRQLAERLSLAIRSDDTVARISGDEFVVLLEDIGNAEHAAVAVDKLMEVFNAPFGLAENEVYITASMGISLYPHNGEQATELLQNADAAMYRAKDEGRNTYQFYTSELTVVAFEHVFLENALRGALENEEFRLVYQPQVDLATGEVIGMEALLRWHHPTQGIISPARFIPIAEQSGLIIDIGTWVLATACTQGKAWLDQGCDIGRIAVNVAGQQIQDHEFVRRVEAVLKASGLPAGHLVLEVTESFVMRRAEASIQQLEALRDRGIEIAIDDFGTGYSSLSYLKQLPIDKLKIDQSFVRDIPHDPNDMAISEAVIVMGKALGMHIIAEGVETDEQASFLRNKGCGQAQGYLFSKPVSAEEMGVLLRR
ncbi:MAG: EAL domain-containing protein [Candidatus Thiodiazotropha sp.]